MDVHPIRPLIAVAATGKRRVELLDLPALHPHRTPFETGAPVSVLAFGPLGRSLAVGTDDGRVELFHNCRPFKDVSGGQIRSPVNRNVDALLIKQDFAAVG